MNETRAKGMVWLVGGGPGDPGLLTRKGAWCLGQAQVVVHDRLSSPELLSLAPEGCEFLDVGKLPDSHPVPQEEINRLLVERAGRGRRVVRLKGGDPFVFGRGGEEALALARAGVPFAVVPGVSSAIAAPACAGIPVTHRDLSTGFQVVTGHERAGKEASGLDWANLAACKSTLVFLMGMAQLETIAQRLITHGRDPATPAAVIENGTLPSQRSVSGTLADIAAKARGAGLANPAVIVVGAVAALAADLAWAGRGRLAGQKVIVTRARDQASRLVELIRAEGGEALEFPAIRIAALEDGSPAQAAFDAVLDRLADFGWLVFTSPNGVEAFFARMAARRLDQRRLAGLKLAVVGPATAGVLEARGLYPDLMPGEFLTEALLAALRERATPGERILLARSDLADPALAQGLAEAGLAVTDLAVYRTVEPEARRDELLGLLRSRMAGWITFTSSSTVANFVKLIGPENLPLLEGCKAVCIGPVTARTARAAGIAVHAEAAPHTIEGLAALLGVQP